MTNGRTGDKSLDWLTDQLPVIEPIARRTEADYYGASHLIASELGYHEPPPSIASWKHGVFYESTIGAPWLLLTEGNRATRHLVANEWHAACLRDAGYKRVHAVGAPFLYAAPATGLRMPNSLLIMPAHRIAKATNSIDEESYADALGSIRDRFDRVLACISATCVREGGWTRALQRVGIPWVTGADSHDRNALRRMRRMFDLFEFVTTDTLGSHVAYASYCGCKVSIWGPYAEIKMEDYKDVPWYRKNWQYLSQLIDCFSEAHVRRRFPELFSDPWEAPSRVEWAKPFLGLSHRRPAADIAHLLGWTPLGQAEATVHRAARRLAAINQSVLWKLRRAGNAPEARN